jgi:hypothetical protein
MSYLIKESYFKLSTMLNLKILWMYLKKNKQRNKDFDDQAVFKWR